MLEKCTFETERLRVIEWHAGAADRWPRPDLTDAVRSILTPAVTRSLPPGWQGQYSAERARTWIEEQDAESTVLVVAEKASGEIIGLVLLSEMTSEQGGADVQVGYLLAEHAWGRGFASELVAGFVDWCRQRTEQLVLYAGVGADNPASNRVLEKCGFSPVETGETGSDHGEQKYRLDLR